MLNYLFLYIIFRMLGSPVSVLLAFIVLYLLVDRTFFGVAPDPFKAFRVSGRIRELKRIIELNPHDARSLKELGIFLFERGDYGGAQRYFERAAPRMLDDPEFRFYYGISVARTGDVHRGRELVDSALQQSPGLKYGDPYLMMAEVYIDAGDYRDALPLLERFEKIHYASVRGLYQLGRVKLRLGMKDEGMDYLGKAVAVYKDAPRFRRRLERKWAWKARVLLRKEA
ncbi:MAG TPA: tetratricopeptide repeat protein [Dissulfurispiraceae bacterium]